MTQSLISLNETKITIWTEPTGKNRLITHVMCDGQQHVWFTLNKLQTNALIDMLVDCYA